MIDMNAFLSIILALCGIILLVVLTVLGIKMIQTLDKMNRILDNVEDKVNSLNGLFSVIDSVSDRIDLISTKVVSTFASTLGRVFKRRKKKEEYEYE